MRRRRVKETRFKTVSYQYPDSDVAATDSQAKYRGHVARTKNYRKEGQPRQHQENQTRRTVAQGVGVGNATDNTTEFSPGTHGNQQNSCESARANRCGVEVSKRLRSRAYAPPPSSSSSGEYLLADKKNFNRRRRRNRTKKSLSEMSTLPLRKEFYGDGGTPQQRAYSSADGGDDGGWFEKDNQPHMTQSNQGFTPMPLGGGNFWHDEDLELADRARHLSISSGSIFVSPQVQSTKLDSRTYQQTNFPDLQPCYKGRYGSRWSRGNDGRQVKRNVPHYAHGAKTMHGKCEEASETVFSGQRTSKERLLPVNCDPGVHFYDESDRLYCERRMVRQFQVKESPQEYSCESAADQDWRGTLADSINLPADPERTERWVHAHYPLVAQPLCAESAANPVFLFGEAATPPQREAPTLGTRNRQANRDTACSNAKEMSQKVKSSAGAFVDTSSEDSSPPLDSKQHQFMPGSASRHQRARMKSYESIIKEEKAKRAVTLSPTKKQSESRNNQACCDNTGRGKQANESGFIDQRGPGTQFGHRTEWLFGQDSKSGYDQILVFDGSENCQPRKGRDPEGQVYKRKEETMPPDDFDYMPRPHACSGARPKNTNEKVHPLPKLKSKMTRNIRLDHFHAVGRKYETCEGKRDQPIQNGSGDQTGWTEELKLSTRSRVQTALRRNAEELDNEAKMQFYSCGEETLTKSSSHMTGNQEIGRTEKLRNEACQDKCNLRIENGRGDQRFSLAEPKHNSRQCTQTATFGNTGKLAYSGREKKTEFYTCSSQSGSEAGEQRSTDNWWSPTAHILPLMPQVKPQERSDVLRSIRSDGFYTTGMAIVPMLQNRASHNVMLTGGISHRSPTNYLDGSAVILYNPRNEAWFFFGTMPEPRCYHTTVLVGGSIIVAGGLDLLNVTSRGRMQPSSKAFSFSIQRQRWYNIANMHADRAFHAAVAWSDCVIVFGGLGLAGFLLRSAEIYSSKTNQWTLVHPMPKALMGVAAVMVDNSIWIFGGLARDSEGSSIEDSSYVFDPRTDAWVTHTPLTMKRAFASAVSVQRDIWLVGGIVNLQPLKCTDRIDVIRAAHHSWELRAVLPLPMHSVQIVKTGSEVFLVGGQTTFNSPREEVIVFDRAQHRFFKVTETPKTLIGFAAVLLPRDSTVLRRHPLSSSKATLQNRWYAATVIQRAYRHYRREGTLRFHLRRMRNPSKATASREASETHSWHMHPNDLVPVHIEKWPPSQPSTISVNANNAMGERSTKKYVHYATLRADMDPNLGMLQPMDDSFLKTRLALGLRMTPERMSPGLRQLKQAQQPGDPCFPVILVIGGLDPRNPLGSGSTVLKYHPLKDRWTLVNVMPEPRSYHAVAHINDSIFVTGGYSTLNRKSGEMAATKTTFIMNTKTGNWERLPDMFDERACHASVATDGRIIAFGGRGHDGRLLSSVEAYDLKNAKWKRLNSMPEPRMGMTAVAEDSTVWLLGGMSDRHNSPTVCEVLLYSLQLDSWTTGPQLRLPRAFASATIIHGNIWLCGGCMNIAEERHPVSVDSIDVGSKHTKWKKTCTLGVARHSASIAIIGSCIYIFGGINSQEWGVLSKSTLVIPDKKAVVSACPMPQPLSGHSAVTLLPTSSQHSLCSSKWSDAIYAKYV